MRLQIATADYFCTTHHARTIRQYCKLHGQKDNNEENVRVTPRWPFQLWSCNINVLREDCVTFFCSWGMVHGFMNQSKQNHREHFVKQKRMNGVVYLVVICKISFSGSFNRLRLQIRIVTQCLTSIRPPWRTKTYCYLERLCSSNY